MKLFDVRSSPALPTAAFPIISSPSAVSTTPFPLALFAFTSPSLSTHPAALSAPSHASLASSFSASPLPHLRRRPSPQPITSRPFAPESLHSTSLHLISLIVFKMLSLASSHSSLASNSPSGQQLDSTCFHSLYTHFFPVLHCRSHILFHPSSDLLVLFSFKHNIITSFCIPWEQYFSTMVINFLSYNLKIGRSSF